MRRTFIPVLMNDVGHPFIFFFKKAEASPHLFCRGYRFVFGCSTLDEVFLSNIPVLNVLLIMTQVLFRADRKEWIVLILGI
jgi:hypothetical protein